MPPLTLDDDEIEEDDDREEDDSNTNGEQTKTQEGALPPLTLDDDKDDHESSTTPEGDTAEEKSGDSKTEITVLDDESKPQRKITLNDVLPNNPTSGDKDQEGNEERPREEKNPKSESESMPSPDPTPVPSSGDKPGAVIHSEKDTDGNKDSEKSGIDLINFWSD